MPRVLVYRSELLPLSETFIKEQILAYRRWQGILVGMRSVNELPLDGLVVRVLRPNRSSHLDLLRWKFNRMRNSVPLSVVGILKSEDASLLHVHFGLDALEAWPIARALGLPMLVTLHGYDININRDWWEVGHGGSAWRDYPNRLLTLGRDPRVSFIAVSNAIRNRAISYGLPSHKIAVRYIGVDTSKFTPSGRPISERCPRVLFVGRLVEKKGCKYLIQAFVKVQQKVPDASLIIAGEGDLRKELQDLAYRLGIHAEFLAALSESEVRQQIELARVLCLPSITASNGDAEGFGLVLLEAQASGVPVVTSAMGGATEGIDDGVTGFRVRARDIETLAQRIITILTDDELAAAMADAGPHFVSDRFDLSRCTRALERHYDDVLLDATISSSKVYHPPRGEI